MSKYSYSKAIGIMLLIYFTIGFVVPYLRIILLLAFPFVLLFIYVENRGEADREREAI